MQLANSTTEMRDYLKANLRISVEAYCDYDGSPMVRTTLYLENEVISESESSIPENRYDSYD